MKNKFYKLIHWEYWPMLMFYMPNIPLALYYAIRTKSFVFYTATNPGLKNAGIGSESKFNTLQIIPRKYVPKSILHRKNQKIFFLCQEIHTKVFLFLDFLFYL